MQMSASFSASTLLRQLVGIVHAVGAVHAPSLICVRLNPPRNKFLNSDRFTSYPKRRENLNTLRSPIKRQPCVDRTHLLTLDSLCLSVRPSREHSDHVKGLAKATPLFAEDLDIG